jgi:GGDEF domain-containing protein
VGGDEFAVLLPIVQIRSDVEEVILRLERCFDEPFGVEGYAIRGSASFGIALYPADATTRDGLLTTADSDMYSSKNHRKLRRKAQQSRPEPMFAPESRS